MRVRLFLALVLLFPALGAPALAQRSDAVLPLDRILPEIRRTHPGQFYDADGPTLGADGLQHYHLKWMTPDGRIEWLDTDARTGRVLGASPGRDTFDQPGAARDYPSAPSYPAPAQAPRFRANEEDGAFWQGFSPGAGENYGNRPDDGRGRGRDR